MLPSYVWLPLKNKALIYYLIYLFSNFLMNAVQHFCINKVWANHLTGMRQEQGGGGGTQYRLSSDLDPKRVREIEFASKNLLNFAFSLFCCRSHKTVP